jgi:hypothetical protein
VLCVDCDSPIPPAPIPSPLRGPPMRPLPVLRGDRIIQHLCIAPTGSALPALRRSEANEPTFARPLHGPSVLTGQSRERGGWRMPCMCRIGMPKARGSSTDEAYAPRAACGAGRAARALRSRGLVLVVLCGAVGYGGVAVAGHPLAASRWATSLCPQSRIGDCTAACRPLPPLRSLAINDASVSPRRREAALRAKPPPAELFGPSPLAPPPAPRVGEMTPDEKVLLKAKLSASLSSLRRKAAPSGQ